MVLPTPAALFDALNPRRSLRARFALVLGASGLAFAMLSALAVDAYQRAELVQGLGQAMRREALLLSRSLNIALQERLLQLRQTAAQPLLASGLMEPGDLRLLLESLRAQQEALAWLAVTDDKGRVEVATNALLQGQDLHLEPWFAPGLRQPWIGQRHAAGPLTRHLGLAPGGQAPQLIDLATPLIDFQGRRLGVLVARLRWDWLDGLHQAMQAPDRRLPGSDSLVLDRDGRVLIGPSALLDQALQLPGLAALQAGAAPQVLTWPDGVAYLTALGHDENTGNGPSAGLAVLVRQPAALAFASADVLRRRLVAAGLVATTLFSLLSIWLAGRIAGPVRALSAAAARVGHGAAPAFVTLPTRRDDEVAGLARTLQALHLQLAQRLADQQQALTEMQRASALLQQREALLAQTSRLAKVGGWTLDLRSQLGTWTEQLTQLYELPADTVPTPELALRAFEGDDHTRLQAAIRQAIINGEPYDLELRMRTPSGRIKWVRAQANAVRENGRTLRLEGITQDITERRQAEEAVRELNARLEQRVAERTAQLHAANAELDSFAYAVSHDLRSPLRAMNGFSLALLEDHAPRLDDEARGYLAQIMQASQRMGHLIDALLALSRSSRGEMHDDPVDLSALARRVVAELRRSEPQRPVAVLIQPGLLAHGDVRMLDSVLHNLLGNAWKYSARTAAPRIELCARQIDGQRWFCVDDNGAGFDMAHAGRLFKAFARLHRQEEFPGIGIGLATVQRIIARHGGQIEAHAEPGQGASFRFTLPEHRPPEPHPLSDSPP